MADVQFSYVAVDPSGRRVRGRLAAHDTAAAFERLKRDGLAPLTLHRSKATRRRAEPGRLGARETADVLSGLADLLAAGADIRTALTILGERFERPSVRAVAEQLAAEIGGGEPLDRAFGRAFRQGFVGPMVAAAEASGDLPGGLRRAAEVVYARLRLRDQLVSVLAYPGFVLLSAIVALFVILLFIVPAIAPLAEELGSEPPLSMRLMIAASGALTGNLTALGVGAAAALLALLLASRAGLLARPVARLLLDGPARRTVGGLVFGAFAVSLGAMLSAGAPIAEAIRLAIRTTPLALARERLEPVAQAVRQGEYLSSALGEVKAFPLAVVRLAAVGEASNTVGDMLTRSGRMEEEAALRRLETAGRIAGPALIVALGLMLGVLMAGLLSGVSQIGQGALE